MSTGERYNGWANYETWLVGLWVDNDAGVQNAAQELTEDSADLDIYDFSARVREFVEDLPEIVAVTENASLACDLLGMALASVDWRELAENWRESFAEIAAQDAS